VQADVPDLVDYLRRQVARRAREPVGEIVPAGPDWIVTNPGYDCRLVGLWDVGQRGTEEHMLCNPLGSGQRHSISGRAFCGILRPFLLELVHMPRGELKQVHGLRVAVSGDAIADLLKIPSELTHAEHLPERCRVEQRRELSWRNLQQGFHLAFVSRISHAT